MATQDLTALLDAIAMVESHNRPNVVGDRQLRHPAIGAFQMRLPAYQDVQAYAPQEFGGQAFEQLQGNATRQRLAAQRYLELLQTRYGLSGDALIAAYNAGPSVQRTGIRNPGYVRRVRAQMGTGNRTMGRFHD